MKGLAEWRGYRGGVNCQRKLSQSNEQSLTLGYVPKPRRLEADLRKVKRGT